MATENLFKHDVLVLHDCPIASIIQPILSRLQADGLKVVVHSDLLVQDKDPSEELDEALEDSRVLLLLITSSAGPAQQASLERQTIGFRNPVTASRRFVPVRINDASLPDFLKNYAFLEWRNGSESALQNISEACRRPTPLPTRSRSARQKKQPKSNKVIRGHEGSIYQVAITPNGARAVSCGSDEVVRFWNVEAETCLNILDKHTDAVTGVTVTDDGKVAYSVSIDSTMRIWDTASGKCTLTHESDLGPLTAIAATGDGSVAVIASSFGSMELFNLKKRQNIELETRHSHEIKAIALSNDGTLALSASSDFTIGMWDLINQSFLGYLTGHTDTVNGIALNSDKSLAWSGSSDRTLRLWNLVTRKCIATLEGHTGVVWSVATRGDGLVAVSGSSDGTVRVWRFADGDCVLTFQAHEGSVSSVALTRDGTRAVSVGRDDHELRIWSIPLFEDAAPAQGTVTRYTNAKVLLVGDSGVGKTGLALRLVQHAFQATVSTDGAWATQLQLGSLAMENGVEREVWLWDFGGQADYRLIHQLFMDETALALLVFNPQIDDPFDGLSQWDRALKRAARRNFGKLLIAGRCDRGGVTVSSDSVASFCKERGYAGFIETSALTGLNCEALREKIFKSIAWQEIPWRSSPRLFKQLRACFENAFMPRPAV